MRRDGGGLASLTQPSPPQTCLCSSKPSWADQVEEEGEDGEYAGSSQVTAASSPDRSLPPAPTLAPPSNPASAFTALCPAPSSLRASLSPIPDTRWPVPPLPCHRPSPHSCCGAEVVTACLLLLHWRRISLWAAFIFAIARGYYSSASWQGCPRALLRRSSPLVPPSLAHPQGPIILAWELLLLQLTPPPRTPFPRQMCHQRAPQRDSSGHWGHQPRT